MAAIVLAFCAGPDEQTIIHQVVTNRTFDTSGISRAVLVDSARADALFQWPLWIAADEVGPYVYDHYAHSVLRFDTAGNLLWKFGRQGEGPWEFSNVRDIRASRGRLYLLDVGLNRITMISSAGEPERMIRMDQLPGTPQKLLISQNGDISVISYPPTFLQATIDTSGRVTETRDLSIAHPSNLHTLQLQGITAQGAGDSWIYAFSVGNGWRVYNTASAEVSPTWGYVEEIGFPEVLTTKTSQGTRTRIVPDGSAAQSAVLTDTSVIILFGGHGEHRGRLLDEYSLITGQYRRSWVIPFINQITTDGNTFYGVRREPTPVLVKFSLQTGTTAH
jgi:hypothetical protein